MLKRDSHVKVHLGALIATRYQGPKEIRERRATILGMAAKGGYVDTLDMLFRKVLELLHADEREKEKENENEKGNEKTSNFIATILASPMDEYERTLLHLAAEDGQIEIVDYLVNKGAPLNQKDKTKSTPIMLAIIRDILRLLSIYWRQKRFFLLMGYCILLCSIRRQKLRRCC